MALAGCSANIARFDSPSFALGDGNAAPSPEARRVAGGPGFDPAPAPAPAGAYAPPPARAQGGVEIASLPAVASRAPEPAPAAPPARAMAVSRTSPPPSHNIPLPDATHAKGQQIEVQQGDTLYAIARRHHTMISELMAVNDLKNPNLKPGQKLYLPAGTGAGKSPPRVLPDRTAAAQVAAGPAAADSGETYTVKPGDSLYSIAAQRRIKVLDLQRLNGITDVRKVKPGLVLRLPSGQPGGDMHATAEANAPRPRLDSARPDPQRGESAPHAAPVSSGPPGVKVINGASSRQIAAVEPTSMTDASAAAPAATPPAVQAGNSQAAIGKLRWPVKGRVVQGFGPRADGSHNDGVDIAVPAGTDVLAAESGVVAYAGSEVKTYGNLVLIRHDNGWVTAYANNEKLLVQRGDRIKRGQPVAKAGKSGGAEQPQLHFEVRVGSKPVDPTAYLDKL